MPKCRAWIPDDSAPHLSIQAAQKSDGILVVTGCLPARGTVAAGEHATFITLTHDSAEIVVAYAQERLRHAKSNAGLVTEKIAKQPARCLPGILLGVCCADALLFGLTVICASSQRTYFSQLSMSSSALFMVQLKKCLNCPN